MLNTLAQKFVATLLLPLVGLFNFAGYATFQNQNPINLQTQVDESVSRALSDGALGSSKPIPDTIALYTDSLQSPISSSATTMTLVRGTYNNSATSLASSTYGFIIDEGTSVEEIVTADCTGTACTNMTRGLSRLSGTTTVSALQFQHRRGASVKITDAPSLLIINRIIQGVGAIFAPLYYDSTVATTTFSSRQQLIDKGYADDLAFNGAGVINATLTAKGVVQLATQLQAASSTALGSTGAPVVLTGDLATSTYNSATAALRVLVTQNNGKLDPNFISTSTGLFTNITMQGTTTINNIATTTTVGYNNLPIMSIGHNSQIFTTSGTFNVPAGVKYFHVRVLGPGSNGAASGGTCCSAGGGGGAMSEGWYDLSGTTTIGVTIGIHSRPAGTTWFGSIASSTGANAVDGGTSFATTSSITVYAINGTGMTGQRGSTATGYAFGGMGGSSPFGGGGPNADSGSGGNNATGYGAGGSGTGSAAGPGNGTDGLVIIDW